MLKSEALKFILELAECEIQTRQQLSRDDEDTAKEFEVDSKMYDEAYPLVERMISTLKSNYR